MLSLCSNQFLSPNMFFFNKNLKALIIWHILYPPVNGTSLGDYLVQKINKQGCLNWLLDGLGTQRS